MNLKERFLIIWKDPVCSKLIATGIIALISIIPIFILSDKISSFLALPKYYLGVILVVILAFIVVFFLINIISTKDSRTLVYVSSGGTCRDPMAKAITTKLLEKYNLKHPLNIIAAGRGLLSKTEASFAARYAIKEIYHEDLLADHKPILATPRLAKKADLILVMDSSLLKGFPPGKTSLFKEFFGLQGDLEDPHRIENPDGKDKATLDRYKECADEIKTILEKNIEHLIKVLNL